MQVLCKSTSVAPDICCSVCGQGFAIFSERQSKPERTLALQEIARTLRNQHTTASKWNAHPTRGFVIPDWDGPAAFSGAAILGNAPTWAL